MAINYSLVILPAEPGKINSAKRVYPLAQYKDIMTLKQFARHIASHGSSFDRGTIEAVLTAAVDCLREQLLLGNRIQLGDMGTFYCQLRSKGADKAENFSAQAITGVNVRWMPSTEFQDLKKDANFNYVPSRKSQALARKASKAAIETTLGNTPAQGGSGNGSGNGSLED